jgi:hypothetical protein
MNNSECSNFTYNHGEHTSPFKKCHKKRDCNTLQSLFLLFEKQLFFRLRFFSQLQVFHYRTANPVRYYKG